MNPVSKFLDAHLITGWRNALRLRIIQVHLIITAVATAVYNMAKAYPNMAQDILTKLPPELLNPVAVNLGLLIWLLIGAYARLAPQQLPPAPPPPNA